VNYIVYRSFVAGYYSCSGIRSCWIKRRGTSWRWNCIWI